jgi:uracil-DNA glycosylase
MSLFEQLHTDWQSVLYSLRPQIDGIEERLQLEDTTPEYRKIFRALASPISDTRVVIVGQDPYPGAGQAQGLAFSVESQDMPLPATLKNIFKELHNDIVVSQVDKGDLSAWARQGVMLLNRNLTTRVGSSLAHKNFGWQEITNEVARHLGARQVVAVLWGKDAGQLTPYFRQDLIISSAHPSPLSAYRGFFGSKPFSRTNELLIKLGGQPIQW